MNNAMPKVVEKVSATVTEFATAALGYVVYIPWLILIPILAFFLLKDAETFRRSALLMLPRGAGAGVVMSFFRTSTAPSPLTFARN